MSSRSILSLSLLAVCIIVLTGGCVSLGTSPSGDIPRPDPSGSHQDPVLPPAPSTLRGTIKLQGVVGATRPISVQIGEHQLTTTSGLFTISELLPGQYAMEVTADHYQTYRQDIVVTGEPLTLELTLQTKYTEKELDLCARLVYAEAGGEPALGQVAVAASVLNRVLSPLYPDTLEEVIMQTVYADGVEYYQYSPVLDGRVWELDPVSQPLAYQAAMEAVWAALGGWDPSLGSTGFFNPDKVSPHSWVWTQSPTVRIGNHQFFL